MYISCDFFACRGFEFSAFLLRVKGLIRVDVRGTRSKNARATVAADHHLTEPSIERQGPPKGRAR